MLITELLHHEPTTKLRTPSQHTSAQFLFLSTLPPVVGAAAGLLAGNFFWLPIPLIVVMTVFFSFTGAAFFEAAAAVPGFLTTVVVLESLESLIALPRPIFGADAAGTVLFPRPAPVLLLVLVLVSVPFRVAAPRVVFAFSTIFVRMLAAPPAGVGATGLSGEIGRARLDRAGETAVRAGERGIEREFADRGERTWDGCSLSREVVRVGTTGPRARFLGFSISSFSLSTEISSLLTLVRHRTQMREYTSIVSDHVVAMGWHGFDPLGSGSWLVTWASLLLMALARM